MTPQRASDPLAVLTALRPSADLDHFWSSAEQAAALDRILHSPRRPEGPVRAPGRARRRALTIGPSGLLVVGGGSAAVAGGLVPQSFVEAFSYWQDTPVAGGPAIDPATAERVATAPGPDGTVFSVLVAHAADDPAWRCTTALFETAQSSAPPGPAVFIDAGSQCRRGPDTAPFGLGAGVAVSGDIYVWDAPAGGAVRGELRTASGERWPLVLVARAGRRDVPRTAGRGPAGGVHRVRRRGHRGRPREALIVGARTTAHG